MATHIVPEGISVTNPPAAGSIIAAAVKERATGGAAGGMRQYVAIGIGIHLVLAFALLHNAWSHPATTIVGPAVIDGPGYGAGGIVNGDSLLLLWFTRWTPFALSHARDPLFTTYMNAPRGANLMWNPLMLPAGLALAPATLLAGSAVGFNLLATIAVALCGIVGTACTSRFVKSPAAAIAGGLMFEFSSFVVAQSQGHQAVVLASAFVPCAVLLLFDVIHHQRSPRAAGLLLGAAAAGAYYTWEETLLATVLLTAIGLVVALAVAGPPRRSLLVNLGSSLAWAALVGLPLAAPGLAMQFLGPQHLSAVAAARPPDIWVIDLQNLVTPTAVQAIDPGVASSAVRGWSGNSFEWGGYLSVPLLAAVVAAVVSQRSRRSVRWLSAMWVIATALSLGPSLRWGGHDTGIPLPWAVFDQLPLVRDVIASRLAVFSALAAAALGAVAIDAMMVRHRRFAFVVSAAIGLAILPSAMPSQPVSAPAFFSHAYKSIPAGSVALIAPFATPLHPQAMAWQAAADMQFRMPEGYVVLPDKAGGLLDSPPPTITSELMGEVAAGGTPKVDRSVRDEILTDLRTWNVKTIVVGPMPHVGVMLELFKQVLGRSPQSIEGVSVWWNV